MSKGKIRDQRVSCRLWRCSFSCSCSSSLLISSCLGHHLLPRDPSASQTGHRSCSTSLTQRKIFSWRRLFSWQSIELLYSASLSWRWTSLKPRSSSCRGPSWSSPLQVLVSLVRSSNHNDHRHWAQHSWATPDSPLRCAPFRDSPSAMRSAAYQRSP